LEGLRGKPNKKRKALIDKAFLKFDSQGEGVIRIRDLAQAYNAELHPRVRTKEISNAQAFQEFTICFNSSNNDGFITKAVRF
jgi:Ca2+-binding EF-hand superfamily protein